MSALSVRRLGNSFMTASALPLCAVIGTAVITAAVPVRADDFSEQQQLVDKAVLTVQAFGADPSVGPAIRNMKDEAVALFIVPQFTRGAFVFGGAGGSGVLIVHDGKAKTWSEPAFYTIGSASFGLQVGVDVSEMIFVVRNQKGLEEFYRSDFKVGGDVSIAMGPAGGEGASLKGITADMIAYAKKKGVFGGISVDGSIIAVSDGANATYYGKAVRPTDILVKRSVSNPNSAELRTKAAEVMQ